MARSHFLLPLAALMLAPLAGAQQIFTYVPSALPAQNIWTDGVVLADVDNDGDNDILFANGSAYGGVGAAGAQPQHLFLNNGSGVFSAAHGNLNVINFNAKLVIAEDFDNDGDLDLFYASGSTGSPPRLLLNNGAGIFTDVTATNVPALALRSFGICAGDVDNDGDLDVVVTDGGTFGGIAAQALLLENNGNAVFTNVTAAKMPVDLYNAQDVTLLDFDGDFDLDIALSGKGATGKRGRLYLNNGSGTFTINNVMNAVGTGSTYEVEWGQLDLDSDFDCAVQSIAGVSEGWASNLGTVTPMALTNFPAPNGSDDNELALVDYDNDGDFDVFIGSLGATERAYRNDGGVFVNVNAIIQAQGDATLDFAFGDLNGDNRYDMVTAQGESGNFTNKVYINTVGAQDTLPPKLVGSSTPAIGNPTTLFHATVTDAISDDGTTQVDLVFDWKTSANPAGGSGTAFHMGGGTHRSAVPTPTGTTWVWIRYTASDAAGNSITFAPTVIGTPPNPWTNIGFGLAGVSGVPSLVGSGPLLPGTLASLVLTNAKPVAPAVMFISLTSAPTFFKGGQLAAFPFVTTLGVTTSGAGSIPLPFLWPAGVPSGLTIYFQWAISDPAAPFGAALSNAVQGIVQ